MMIINCDEYKVRLDKYQWITAKRSVPEKGKFQGVEQWIDVAFHRTLSQSAEYVMERLLIKVNADNMIEISAKIEEAKNEIIKAIKDAGIPDSWKDANSGLN